MNSRAEISRANGRKGGRPKGSTTKPQIKDFIDKEEVNRLVSIAKEKAAEGDTNILKFLLEQIFGKAPQSLAISGGLKISNLLDELDGQTIKE